MSEYTVKYRPQKISELDLISVREGLEKVLKSGKIPHAFLFSGPRGTGKTSAARIIAKAVNCIGKREKGDFEPCNLCEQCLSITAGNNLDVLEIDAASNRGIDDIRDLREKIKLAPGKSKYKVYIIDEVHMLTLEAFNALLKTLEEPPSYVIFILCTTAAEKLPDTIVSRCMRFNFKRATTSEIVAKLEKICQEEKLEFEEQALREIALNVSGSFRDAQKILEQASFSGGKITVDQIKEILGQTIGLTPEKLLEFLLAKDVKGAISEIGRLVEIGGNLKFYTESLLEILRESLLFKIGVFDLKIEDFRKAKEVANSLTIEEIKYLIEIFSKAALELKETIIPQLPLELAVVEWCGEKDGLKKAVDLEESKKDKEEKSLGEKESSNSHSQPLVGKRVIQFSLEEIRNHWDKIMLSVRPKNHSVEALLRATRPIDLNEEILTLEVFYKFHKDQLETEKCRRIVEETVSEFLGRKIGLKCVLGEKKPVKKEEKIEEEHTSSGKESEVLESDIPGNGEAVDEDIIKVAKEIFSGIIEE